MRRSARQAPSLLISQEGGLRKFSELPGSKTKPARR
jgi:hypothetical protein